MRPFTNVALYLCALTFISSQTDIRAQAQTQKPDPIDNFCRRWDHQTAVIGDKLFIDGGLVEYGNISTNVTNTFLLYADLSSASNKTNFPLQYDNLSKPADIPSLAGGILWSDEVNEVFHLFGGEYDSTTQIPHRSTLYSYDVLCNTWSRADADVTASPRSHGAGTVDPYAGTGYYYGGWQSNATQYGYSGDLTAQSDLISYDFTSKTWRADQLWNDTKRAEGSMHYIPASDQGMLVYLGGVQESANGSGATVGSDRYIGTPMETVFLYDIASGKDYTQTTSGGPPPMRRRFCGGVSWPDDQSSYNIYIYGGLPPYGEEGVGYGDVWILSIPSFTWTSYWNDTYYHEHHSASCNVVQNGQMIVMGGYFDNSSNVGCDSTPEQGMHNLNLGANDPDKKEWYPYMPELKSYSLPPSLTDVVGGTTSGGASMITPSGGFDHPDLSVYFSRHAPTNTRTAMRATTCPSKSKNKGAIAGGVVGGVVFLLVIGSCLYVRKRRKTRALRLQGTENSHASIAEVHGHSYYDGSVQKSQLDDGYYAHELSQHHSPSGSQPTQSPSWQRSPLLPQQQSHSGRPQQYYPPPPQAQQYYPPPPLPETSEIDAPAVEMPNVRSPATMSEATGNGKWRASSAGTQHTINEE